MQQALLVRLRPSGPWRYGPSDGALDRVDTLFRSDRLFSAVTIAMRQLGHLDGWLKATVRNEKPAVAFSSLFPFQGDTLYVTPPANLWPPPSSLVTSPSPVFLTKIRWRAAHFVPISLVDSLLTGQAVLADQWIPDTESGCLLRRDRPSSSPFRTVSRGVSPVDRLRLTAPEAEVSACVEFEAGAGLWTVARFLDDAAHAFWNEPLQAAFRLLADSGFGGGRSKGWGQVQMPEFENGAWPGVILPKVGRSAKNDVHEPQTSRSYWLMSLYSPSSDDTINWSGGQYELAVRNGRVDGSTGVLKKSVRMVVEGCVLDAAAEPVGTAIDVAPEGFAHPVYRSGIALSLLIPPPKPRGEDVRAIEEIVPPELAATPFPVPAPNVEPPESKPETIDQPYVEPDSVPARTPREVPSFDEPEPEHTPAPIEEPTHEPKPVPVQEPEEKPEIHEPEPEHQPAPIEEPNIQEPDVEEPEIDEPDTFEPEIQDPPPHEDGPMKYKLTALTPLLVGDGRELSPVDYMVWKDQVNVLDQTRIFKLLARGPRLEGYLSQLRKATRLDFASWGGFAQSFSQRRIAFDNSDSTSIWNAAPTEALFIPTFAATYRGAYLPASSVKGALRTALLHSRWSTASMDKIAASLEGDRVPRRIAEAAESQAGASQVRILGMADSDAIPETSFKVYLTRTSSLDTRQPEKPQLVWKIAGRGSVPNQRIGESSAVFAEMAVPGVSFEGSWMERSFLKTEEFTRALGWRSVPNMDLLINAANQYAGAQLEIHAHYARVTGLVSLQQNVQKLREQLATAQNTSATCLLCLGWGNGFIAKAAYLGTDQPGYRKVLRSVPALNRSIRDGVVFPKTRRIVFGNGNNLTLPGWVTLQLQN